MYPGGSNSGAGFIFSADETTDVGYESGTPVSPDYAAADSNGLTCPPAGTLSGDADVER